MNQNFSKFLAVVGDPVSHSLSPTMHNAMIRQLNLDFYYSKLWLKSEQDMRILFNSLKKMSFFGLNITVPYKVLAFQLCDKTDAYAQSSRAVNTIIYKDGSLHGYNTDGIGLLVALNNEKKFKVEGKSVTIIGAGGSAKGIAFALSQEGISHLSILNRSENRALQLRYELEAVTRIPIHVGSLSCNDHELSLLKNSDLVIQTTSCGMSPNEDVSPLDNFSWVNSGQLVCDIIYKPSETLFLHHVRKNGGHGINGLAMLVGQGARAFKYFTNKDADYMFMKQSIM